MFSLTLKSKLILGISITCFLTTIVSAQKPNFTANEQVDPFNVPFGYGANPGYYDDNQGNPNNPGFDREGVSYDVALAQLAAKVGLNTTRPSLPCYFFLTYGNSTTLGNNNFQIRKNEFEAYIPLGIKNQVAFIGDATDHHDGQFIDPTKLIGNQYRNLVKYPNCNSYSYEFKNLYSPIWDNGANGTQINDTNYYALYIYKLVTNYKANLKVYEIVNEIDFTAGGFDASKGPGNDGWYDRAPKPCELLNWRAPIYSYVRTLRIAYEVIKSIDPTAYIAIGGIGYESFLDATLRYTDNPIDGSVNNDYPKKGGAYFDMLSYHHYPHYDLRKKAANGIDNVFPFVYLRHSDEAVYRTVFRKKETMQAVLSKYNYDGGTGKFPAKHFIITEANIPRRTYPGQDWIGSDDAQRNYLMKLFVKAQTNNIDQVHVFNLGEKNDLSDISNYEGHEGLYENLTKAKRTTAKKTPAGIGVQSLTKFIGNSVFDAQATASLLLPSSIDGAAFKSSNNKYTYVLWAKTKTDNSEVSSANFTFPNSLGFTGLTKADWDYSATGIVTTITSSSVSLTGSPSFFTNITEPIATSSKSFGSVGKLSTTLFPNPTTKKTTLSFNINAQDIVSITLLDNSGKEVSTLKEQEKLEAGVHYFELDNLKLTSGLYFVKLNCLLSGNSSVSKLIITE